MAIYDLIEKDSENKYEITYSSFLSRIGFNSHNNYVKVKEFLNNEGGNKKTKH